uniref:Uncharacterized protein n=1 Tax=Salmonella phage vB_Si_CECAV_FGS009 TaxID=3126494 RepID=A0AAU6PY24_9CAUD
MSTHVINHAPPGETLMKLGGLFFFILFKYFLMAISVFKMIHLLPLIC